MSQYDVTEFESMMSLDKPLNSSTATRWERRAARQQQLSTSQSSALNNSGIGSVSGQQPSQSDRYIPNRSGMDFDLMLNMSSDGHDLNDAHNTSINNSDHAKLLLANTLGESAAVGDANNKSSSRVLAFKNKAPAPVDGYQSSLKVLYSSAGAAKKEVVKASRHISSAPVRVLDAPDMLDDYYLNLLSWSNNNILAVGLSQCVYLWDAANGSIRELMNVDNTNNSSDNNNNYITSVSWIQHGGNHLAIGTADNTVQLFDVTAGRCVRALRGHNARVSSLSWNNHILSSGGKDNVILHHDVRQQQHVIGRLSTHTQEVCGLSWSPDGLTLASGANDNTICLSDLSSISTMDYTPRHAMTEHNAAVKAVAWSPHERGLLATGGGTADRCIKFWNTNSGTCINSVDTGSQVCALQWSPFEKELLSSHGYADNQLCLWKYPNMTRMKELKGHTTRALHMSLSPDGTTVCTGAADETLRFWNVFASEGKKRGGDVSSASSSAAVSGLKTTSSLKIR